MGSSRQVTTSGARTGVETFVTTELIHHFRPRGAAAEAMRYRGGEVLLAGCSNDLL